MERVVLKARKLMYGRLARLQRQRTQMLFAIAKELEQQGISATRSSSAGERSARTTIRGRARWRGNCVGLHELTEHRVKVEHTEESAEAKVERIKQIAALLGVDVGQLLGRNVSQKMDREQKLIEAEVVETGNCRRF